MIRLKEKILYLGCKFEVLEWDPQDYIERRTYRSLKRAWIGFKIAKKDGDREKMKYYAEGIQKFERQLHFPVSDFSDILKGVQETA